MADQVQGSNDASATSGHDFPKISFDSELPDEMGLECVTGW